MKLKLHCGLAALVLFTAVGCKSTGDGESYAKTDSGDSDGRVCKMEKRVGSNMMTRVCTTATERERMREAAQDGWLRVQKSSETGGSDR